ncbi:MAG: Sua5 family C-terminal domain-containing protein, partial [Actinomycetes bacterium]
VLDADPSVRAPGTLAAHYAPSASVIVVDESGLDAVVASHQASGLAVGLLAGSEVGDREGTTRLAAPSSVDEYARQLYAALRLADDLGLSVVVSVPPPDRGVGQAVRDRLRRAATGSGR